MKLIPNWRRAWRFASMWCYTVIAFLCIGWLLAGWITDRPVAVGELGIGWILGLSFMGALLRLVAQPGLIEDLAAEAAHASKGNP